MGCRFTFSHNTILPETYEREFFVRLHNVPCNLYDRNIKVYIVKGLSIGLKDFSIEIARFHECLISTSQHIKFSLQFYQLDRLEVINNY